MVTIPLLIVAFSYRADPYWMYIIWLFCWDILGGGIVLYYCKRNCGLSMRYYVCQVVKPCLLLFLCTSFISAIPIYVISMESSFTRLMLCCILSVSSFFLSFYLFGIGKNEKMVLWHILKKVLNK